MNKKKKVKKTKHKQNVTNEIKMILQLDNFLIKKYKEDGMGYLRISDVNDSWRMEFREDTFKYSWILLLGADKKYHDILLAWIVLSFHMSMCVPDPQFIDDMLKSLEDLGRRSVERDEQKESGEVEEDEEMPLQFYEEMSVDAQP